MPVTAEELIAELEKLDPDSLIAIGRGSEHRILNDDEVHVSSIIEDDIEYENVLVLTTWE